MQVAVLAGECRPILAAFVHEAEGPFAHAVTHAHTNERTQTGSSRMTPCSRTPIGTHSPIGTGRPRAERCGEAARREDLAVLGLRGPRADDGDARALVEFEGLLDAIDHTVFVPQSHASESTNVQANCAGSYCQSYES